MKFGNIINSDWFNRDSSVMHINIGDYIQPYAIRKLYAYMGIREEDIVELTLKEAASYDGEDLLVAVTNLNCISRLSHRIHAVCVGYNNFGYEICEEEVECLKQMDLVGCRDERNFAQLVQRGVNAYINGCVTVTLPKKEVVSGEDVFIVDAPKEILSYMPEELMDRAKIRTHEYYYQKGDFPTRREIVDLVERQYMEYYNRAKLVITSRLHLASPCVAWGIPVILVRRTPFVTFSWIDKYIPIYTPETYREINWNPIPLDLEREKKVILRDMSYAVMKRFYELERIMEVHSLYSNRPYRPQDGYYHSVIDGLKKYISKHFEKAEEFHYIIWGITENAELLWKFISEQYQNAVCDYAVDTYKRALFHGLRIVRPEEADYRNRYVFVIPTGAVQAARVFLKDQEYEDCYFVTETFVNEDDIKEAKEENMEKRMFGGGGDAPASVSHILQKLGFILLMSHFKTLGESEYEIC